MWIIAIGWMYVVTLMAATEPTVVGGIMTFFGYGVLPFSLVFYLAGSRRRRARAARTAPRAPDGTAIVAAAGAGPGPDGAPTEPGCAHVGGTTSGHGCANAGAAGPGDGTH